jgi:hypothetical protein
MSADGNDPALSADQRICCSTRWIRDSTSVDTVTKRRSSSNTTSTVPRAGRVTATSTQRRQLGAAVRSSSSTIRLWIGSRTDGPVFGKTRIDRSAPSAVAIAFSTGMLGSRVPDEIWLR